MGSRAGSPPCRRTSRPARRGSSSRTARRLRSRAPTAGGKGYTPAGNAVYACKPCEGLGHRFGPGVFQIFKPERVEKIVTEHVTVDEVEKLEKRGIDAVIVEQDRGLFF